VTSASISSRQASELLDVHESSIKRWCNSGELACWYTAGGHRRIPVSGLVDFAQARGINAPITAFGRDAERVWIGLEAARDGDFAVLSRLLFEWLERQQSERIEHLYFFLVESGLSPGLIFDGVLAGAMRRVGVDYDARQITIGDEHRMTQSARDALIGVKRILGEPEQEGGGRRVAIVGCARSEVHEMGALVIRLILQQQGWRVLYLGADVPTEEFHIQLTKHAAELICVSLSPMKGEPTALEIIKLLELLAEPEHPFRIAIGGAAVENRAVETGNSAIMEARLFRDARNFEKWIGAVQPAEQAAPTTEP